MSWGTCCVQNPILLDKGLKLLRSESGGVVCNNLVRQSIGGKQSPQLCHRCHKWVVTSETLPTTSYKHPRQSRTCCSEKVRQSLNEVFSISHGFSGTCWGLHCFIWHVSHSLHICSTSESRFGHRTKLQARALVFTIPWCPEWISFKTAFLIFEGTMTLVPQRTQPCSVDNSLLLVKNTFNVSSTLSGQPSMTCRHGLAHCQCVSSGLLKWLWAAPFVDVLQAVSGQ